MNDDTMKKKEIKLIKESRRDGHPYTCFSTGTIVTTRPSSLKKIFGKPPKVRIIPRKRLTSQRVNNILNSLGIAHHYLRYKHVSTWDKYDKSNWNAIIRNTKFKNWMKK